MKSVYCLDCDHSIKLNPRLRVGDSIACPSCESEFQLISLNPPEIEWLYDDWQDEEDEIEDGDDEEMRGNWRMLKPASINAIYQNHAYRHRSPE